MQTELEQLKIDLFQKNYLEFINTPKKDEFLNLLENYECWVPYCAILEELTEKNSNPQLADFLRYTKAQSLLMQNSSKAQVLSALIVKRFQLSYKDFREQVLQQVIREEDWNAEAAILQSVCDHFKNFEDAVSCLERLCLILEKKLHNEERLSQHYEKLLAIDPKNLKALRYFKVIFAQGQEWDSVESILKAMLDCKLHTQERFRVAQELASTLLYQQDKPQEALMVLDEHCQESPLDSSMIRFESHKLLGNFDGCLKVLRECLLGTENDYGRGIIHYHIGQIYEEHNLLDSAYSEYQKVNELIPNLLEPVEARIRILIAKKNWPLLLNDLKIFQSLVKDEKLLKKTTETVQRLMQVL